MRKRRPEKLYGTKQVAQFLNIPEWRVKNFSEGEAYGLPPSQTVGTGRGSRRLYRQVDVCRIAIANELVTCGFTPEAVGKAVREIPESTFAEALSLFDAEPETDPELFNPVLVCSEGKWRMKDVHYVKALMKFQMDDQNAVRGIFMLSLSPVLTKVGEPLRTKPGAAGVE